MPELPEIQAHAERLERDFAGAELARFIPLTFTALKTATPPPDAAYGRPLASVGRRGKHLLAGFGDLTFVIHLMQGGRLRVDEKQSAKPRFGQARWKFADGRAWLLTEAGTERRAGVWVVGGDARTQTPLAKLGPDATDLTPAQLFERLRANPMRLHGFLRDQHVIAGLGRRLANEVGHRAQLSPFASTAKLTSAEAERLSTAIHDAVDEGLAYERTRDDMSSSEDRPGNVHHRTGEACPVCGDTIRAVEYRSYTVHYCPRCQTGGRILADNVTSKFLK